MLNLSFGHMKLLIKNYCWYRGSISLRTALYSYALIYLAMEAVENENVNVKYLTIKP